jgi:activator of 2-hydroxyglutaryl-CoA dehydratase
MGGQMQAKDNTGYNAADRLFSGLEIGSVSIKWVQRQQNGEKTVRVIRHEGNPSDKVREILDSLGTEERRSVVVTGNTANLPNDIIYRSETECLEKALAFYDLKPDILLSLGGETFIVYTLRNGRIRNIIASSKCAAGTGEFLVQQFQRMGYSLTQGIEAYAEGSKVDLATRCSVHCKSDATHKLNKGECSRADIARSLIDSLAEKIRKMIELSQWPSGLIFVTGGVANNSPFIAHLKHLMEKSEIILMEESPYFGAFGASLFASDQNTGIPAVSRYDDPGFSTETLSPLKNYEHLLDYRVKNSDESNIIEGRSYILAVDAGSTTTKAVLLDADNQSIGAGCYLRTLGNPVLAVKECLNTLIKKRGTDR